VKRTKYCCAYKAMAQTPERTNRTMVPARLHAHIAPPKVRAQVKNEMAAEKVKKPTQSRDFALLQIDVFGAPGGVTEGMAKRYAGAQTAATKMLM
jgi:hypothetical protein